MIRNLLLSFIGGLLVLGFSLALKNLHHLPQGRESSHRNSRLPASLDPQGPLEVSFSARQLREQLERLGASPGQRWLKLQLQDQSRHIKLSLEKAATQYEITLECPPLEVLAGLELIPLKVVQVLTSHAELPRDQALALVETLLQDTQLIGPNAPLTLVGTHRPAQSLVLKLNPDYWQGALRPWQLAPVRYSGSPLTFLRIVLGAGPAPASWQAHTHRHRQFESVPPGELQRLLESFRLFQNPRT